jgi:hypothetical protein
LLIFSILGDGSDVPLWKCPSSGKRKEEEKEWIIDGY